MTSPSDGPAYDRAYYLAHRDEKRAYDARRRAVNPYRIRASRAKQRFGEAVHWSVLARISHLPCFACGTEPADGVDHIIARPDGGRNVIENLQPACLPCNKRKGADS